MWLNCFGLARIIRASWATSWVHFFCRSFSIFQIFPGAQLEKSQIICVLWIPTSFSPSVLYHLYLLFINFSFSLFPCLPCFLFLNLSFYSGKSQSIFQPAVLNFDSPMSAHPLAEVEWMGLFPHLWNAATSKVKHCSHSVFSMCLALWRGNGG